ncbi:MAG: nitroreductase family protein [Clostridia bacterium]|nr:nitroreductase family protein [Clostridia bacterium]
MEIKDLINERRTIRKFSQNPLTNEQLVSYIDAARIAPSAANLQPLKYAVVTDKQMNDKVFETLKWAGYLKGEYTPKENERPTGYIVVCGDSDIKSGGYDMDVGAAVENIILTALADGVGSCWLGSVERPRLKRLLKLPDNLEISCVIALGYPAEEPKQVAMIDGDIKYYLENETLCVPKRSLDEIIIKKA